MRRGWSVREACEEHSCIPCSCLRDRSGVSCSRRGGRQGVALSSQRKRQRWKRDVRLQEPEYSGQPTEGGTAMTVANRAALDIATTLEQVTLPQLDELLTVYSQAIPSRYARSLRRIVGELEEVMVELVEQDLEDEGS
jgi:hypothetical protein